MLAWPPVPWYPLTVMTEFLQYRAGRAVLPLLREEGLRPRRVRVFAGPAGGPKWFVSVGFDRALIESRFLQRAGHRVLLVGASAGAWRCLAMACKVPLNAYEKLRIAYSRNVFNKMDTPESIGAALKRNVEDFLGDADVPFILDHPDFDLAIHSVRSRGPAASWNRKIEGSTLIGAFLLNMVARRGLSIFYERVIFISAPVPPLFLENSFRGRSVGLNRENLRQAALATGSLPYIVAGVRNIPAAPPGTYRDGGLADYQLNQDYCPGEEGITLFFHHQERIIPGWFDKVLPWRKPPKGSLDRVLQIYPGRDFLRLLPDGRVPDRTDFTVFANDPAERIRRWDRVSELSSVLGEEFLEDVESGRIGKKVRPLRA